MDDFSIKSGGVGETPVRGGSLASSGKTGGFAGSLGGLAATFTELMKKMGGHANGSLSAATAQAELSAGESQDVARVDDDDRDDPAPERAEKSRNQDDRPRPERADTRRDDRDEIRTGDQEKAPEKDGIDARSDSQGADSNDRKPVAKDKGSEDRAGTADKGAGDDKNAATDQSQGSTRKAGSDANDSAAQGQGQAAGKRVKKAPGTASTSQQQAQMILAGLASAHTETQTQTGQVGAEQKMQANGDANRGEIGQTVAADAQAAAGKKTAGAGGIDLRNTHAGQTQAAQGQNGQDPTKGQSQGQSQGQFQNVAGNQDAGGNVAAATVKSAEGAARQAADLARMTGDGNRIAIDVNVTDEANTLLSKPGTILSASTVGAKDNTAAGQHGQPAVQSAAVAAQAAGTTGQQGSTQSNGSNQGQQSAQQASQIQGASTDAKGPGQAGVHTGQGGQAAQAEGGAPVASGNAANETNQTHKTAQTQATAQTQRPAVHNPAFVDQVSVHITKAVKEGIDKINIQLRPASLGRIDVEMEVGQDGRISATVTADNKATLDLLQRDARGLERALQDAGLQTDAGSMNFNLREQNDGRGDGTGKGSSSPTQLADTAPEAPAGNSLESILASEYRSGVRADGRVDIRI